MRRMRIVVVGLVAVILVVAAIGFGVRTGDSQQDGARPVQGDPAKLVVQPAELPPGFVLAGGAPQSPGEYSHVYVNPKALQPGADPAVTLFGVIVNLSLLDSPAAAARTFSEQEGLDVRGVRADIKRATPDAKPLAVEHHPIELQATDKVAAFRVHYVLQGQHVYEYRFRLLVGNAVANLIVSARAGDRGDEPGTLLSQARSIAERQVARLVAAIK